MTGTWNKCFLCLSDMPSVSRKRKRRISSVNLEIILKYLLQTNKDDNHLFQSILQLQSCETDGGQPLVKLCERCESAKQKISELHRQLEVVQMKLIDCIGTVRRAVIQASEQGGRLEENGANIFPSGDVLEVSSKRTNDSTNSSSFQNVLRAFQNVVQERDKDCENVPLYLERCLRYTKVPQARNRSDGQESFQSVVMKDVSIKTELFLDESFDDGDLPEADVTVEPSFEEEAPDIAVADKTNLDLTRPKMKQIRRRRKPRKYIFSVTKKRKRTVAVPIIKMEAPSIFKFDCKMCPYQLRKYQSFRIEHHLRQHETTLKNFKCPQCPTHEGFSSEQLFQLHLTYHKKSTGMYCIYCNKRFSKMKLGDHLRTHVDQVFQCEGCSFSTTSQEKFLQHSDSYRTKTDNFKCHICAMEFRSRIGLLTHLHQVHQAIEMKVCNFEGCGMKFLGEVKLMTHKRTHGSSVICQECGKVFVNAYGLQAHQLVHTGEHPFPCDECAQAFRAKCSLDAHKIRDHSAPKFKCSECDKEYSTSSQLSRHVAAIHEGIRYPCEHCDKIYNTKTLLRRHGKMHTAQEELVCEVCQKKFTMLQSLKKHMLIHKGERNFVCNYCSKSFTFDKYLQNHLRTHTGDKPYLCAYCGKAFNQVAGLYLHKKSQHVKEFEMERLAKK